MKKIFAASFLVAASFVANAAQAAPITDDTKNVSYRYTSPYNWFPGPSSIGDVIEGGPEFDTKEVEVTVSDLSIAFKFLTQFDGDDLGAHYADIFIASDPLQPDSYDLGLSLGFQQTHGGVAAGLYAIAPGDYQTSIDRWKTTGYIYGGKYISPNDSAPHDAPTIITGGTLLSGWTVSAVQSASGDPSFPLYLEITLSAMNKSTFFNAFAHEGFSALWGTGDCNNDSVYMPALHTPPHTQDTPEPASLALFTGGLFGFGAVRRRFVKARVA